jgi:hypothetical protein
MMGFLSLCLVWGWVSSTGTVDYYNLYADYNTEEPLLSPVYQNMTVCFHDQLPHVVAVQGVEDMGPLQEPLVGPLSPWSLPVTMTFNNGNVFYPVNDADRADFDGSGAVDGGDFGTFSFVFGQDAVQCVPGLPCE